MVGDCPWGGLGRHFETTAPTYFDKVALLFSHQVVDRSPEPFNEAAHYIEY